MIELIQLFDFDKGYRLRLSAPSFVSQENLEEDIFWIVHNFIRKHFTTKKVPAVALGILKEGLSWEQMLKIQSLPAYGSLVHVFLIKIRNLNESLYHIFVD